MSASRMPAVECCGQLFIVSVKLGGKMLGWLKRSWLKARTLSVLQTYYEQPLNNPLNDFNARLLSGAVNLTLQDGGTPFDAASRFYAAYAEAAIGQGRTLNDINFGGVLGRQLALQSRMRFYGEHVAAFKAVSAVVRGQ